MLYLFEESCCFFKCKSVESGGSAQSRQRVEALLDSRPRCLRPWTPSVLFTALCSWPAGFAIYFGYGLWHSEEASLVTKQAKTADGSLDHCK